MTTSVDASSGLTAYTYDGAGRLTGITPPAGSAASFTFDALDRHASRTVGSTTDTYAYVGPSQTAYQDAAAATTTSIVDEAGARLATKTGASLAWDLFDLHGSIAALATTSVSDAYRYDGWGQTVGSSGSSANPWRYRGNLDLSPNGVAVYEMGARAYSPQLGTFISLDAASGKAMEPLSLNRYLYAEADPSTLVDPSGHGVDCGIGETCTHEEWLGDLARATTYRQRVAAVQAAAGGAPSMTAVTVSVLQGGWVVWSGGTLASQDQFATLSAACGSVWGPAAPGSACEAWQKTKEVLTAGRDAPWLPSVAEAAVEESLKSLRDDVSRSASINLRIAYVEQMTSFVTLRPSLNGRFQAALWAEDASRFLGKLAVTVSVVGSAEKALSQAEHDVASGRTFGYSLVRGAGRAGVDFLAGSTGGSIGAAAGAYACEVLSLGSCTPVALGLMVFGSAVGVGVGDAFTDVVYLQLDNAGMGR